MTLSVAKYRGGQWHFERMFQTLSQEFLRKHPLREPPTSLPLDATV